MSVLRAMQVSATMREIRHTGRRLHDDAVVLYRVQRAARITALRAAVLFAGSYELGLYPSIGEAGAFTRCEHIAAAFACTPGMGLASEARF
jgi:hypothetical protein